MFCDGKQVTLIFPLNIFEYLNFWIISKETTISTICLT